MRKNKIDLVKGWLEKARRDLITAQKNLASENPFTDIICFHSQQAAEKYVKAFLLWEEVPFPKTHAIEDLILLAAQKDSSFLKLKQLSTELTPYAVETRYPEFEAPLLKDAEKAIQSSEQIKDFVLHRLPDELSR